MATRIDAVYETGVFRTRRAIALREGEEVELAIVPRGMAPRAGVTDSEFTVIASEKALARIWNDPADDQVWAHL